jgi:hypothetical protein
MTAEQIIEIRRSMAIAVGKASDAHDASPRNPAIRDALDPDILSDELFQIAKNPPNDLNLDRLANFRQLKSLIQFRKYYENGNGNNWNNFDLNNFNSYLKHKYQANERVSNERVHAECWILAAEDVGGDSKLTDGMRFLLNELRPGFGDDEFVRAMENLEQRPNASLGQIAAARHYPDSFKALLNTLLTGEGEGWLTHFVNHPLRKEVLKPQWGIYSNGNHHDLALCIPTNAQQVEITQGGLSLRMNTYEGRVVATVGLMRRAGIDHSAPCAVAGVGLPQLDVNSPHIARVRRNTQFSPFLENYANLQIQAVALWAAVPSSLNGEFRLGDERPDVDFDQNITGFGYLHKLELGSIDRSEPQPLTFAGACLVNIGAAPELTVAGAAPWVLSLLEPETHFVFGNKVELKISDIGVNQDHWSCTGGASLIWENGGCSICGNGNYGKKISVNADVERTYPIRVVVRFLPPEMLEAMSNEQAWQEADLSWHPLPIQHVHFTAALTQAGLVRGTLNVGDESVMIWFPSLRPHFWFRHGFNPTTQIDLAAEFASVEELTQSNLHIYVPPGTHEIIRDGEPWIECEGPGYWEESISVGDMDWPFPRKIERLELKCKENDASLLLASVAAQPLFEDEQGRVHADPLDCPTLEQFLGGRFDIDDLAYGIQSMRFRDLKWPMEWSWSGRQMKSRFVELFEKCRRIQPHLTREENRNLMPTLNSILDISKGNGPVGQWIPLSAFRFKISANETTYHPLTHIHLDTNEVGSALLGAKVLDVRFTYAHNTVFTRPNQQKAMPWHFCIPRVKRNAPNWITEQFKFINKPLVTAGDLKLSKEIFEKAISYAKCLVAAREDQRLGYAFLEISSEFEQNSPHRAMCFQVAVMCRLHARMEAHYDHLCEGDDFLKLSHPQFVTWLQHLSRAICECESARQIFNTDLLTVDWAIAWFHEPI